MSTQRHVEIDIRADYNPERAAQCRAHSEVLSCRELSLLPSFLPSSYAFLSICPMKGYPLNFAHVGIYYPRR